MALFERKYATPEDAYKAKLERNRLASKRRKAERAIASGREPGKVGGVVKYNTEQERAAARKAALAKWREKNIEYVRERDAEIKRRERRERAAREGRKLQKVGGDPKFTSEERRERARLNSLAYAAKYPEKVRASSARYYSENKESVLQNCRNRRARKRAAEGTHTAEDIALLWEFQRGKCVFCLKPLKKGQYHIDHHIPLALGGSNDRGNLRLLHKRCNLKKGAIDPALHATRNGLLCW